MSHPQLRERVLSVGARCWSRPRLDHTVTGSNAPKTPLHGVIVRVPELQPPPFVPSVLSGTEEAGTSWQRSEALVAELLGPGHVG